MDLNKLVHTFITISQLQMKILKIFIVILIPALGIVGCRKSDCKPHGTSSNTTTTASPEGSQVIAGRSISPNAVVKDDKSNELVSSGDEDRDGGDKRKKKK